MPPVISSAIVRFLNQLDPELAHGLALKALRFAPPVRAAPDYPILRIRVFDLDFRNPVGLAAGFDKDAECIAALTRCGFGFIETGTVTPLPQSGNPKPRLFRLSKDEAIINRMGFNNRGIEAFARSLGSANPNAVVVGANIGINRTGSDPERDFPLLAHAIAINTDYITVNVSSPNTVGLRLLQSSDRLEPILGAIRRGMTGRTPLLVKIAPDLSSGQIRDVVDVCVDQGVDGLVVSNTTVHRPRTLQSKSREEIGGLSGPPLFSLSTAVLAQAHQFARGRLKLVGVGGIRTGDDAFTKIQAGAHLVQIYTAFVYGGPAAVRSIKRRLVERLSRAGFANIDEAVGTEADRLAREATLLAR